MTSDTQRLQRTKCEIVTFKELEPTKIRLGWLGYKIVSIDKTKNGNYIIKSIEKTRRVARRAICEC